MMRFFPQELFIMRLKRQLPRHRSLDWLREMSDEECLSKLRKLSGLDLGADPDAWQAWWKEERARLDIDPDFDTG
jgi:hypothetical protein